MIPKPTYIHIETYIFEAYPQVDATDLLNA
jgi:hypothetical protein